MKKYVPLAAVPILIILLLILRLAGNVAAQPLSRSSQVLTTLQRHPKTLCAEVSAQPHTSQPPIASQGQRGDYPGAPAITPTMPGHVPAFTAADVCAYIHAHNFAPGIDDSKITRILFIPSSEAFALMKGEQTGIADNEMVCYVEFANINITLNDVSRPVGAQPPFIHTGQIVYNAATGNVLVWGGL